MNRTKIVATIGPASRSEEQIAALVAAGMNIARLNASHSDLDWHAETIARLRRVAPEIPILMDIPGRKIRTTRLAHEPSFKTGERIILTTDTSHDGTEKIPVNYAALHEDLSAGNTILADDGTLRFTVESVEGQDITCIAENDGSLRSAKGINVPFVTLRTELVTDRDQMMVKFAEENTVDFIGISFVESADHVNRIRSLTNGVSPRILAKIENQGGLNNMTEVIDAADAIMIDRGDLSVETNIKQLALFQKRILAAATQGAKPVIVATEMLHTMIENPFPTKAEVSDITNAILDGAAATMLSGETAAGRYPVEAVATMREIVDSASTHVQDRLDAETSESTLKPNSMPDAMRSAIGLLCRSLPITKIVAITRSGYAARMVSATNPKQPILAVSDDERMARSYNLLSGTKGIFVEIGFERKNTNHIPECLHALYQRGELNIDDVILVTAVSYPKSGNRMNLIETHAVGDLAETLGW